MIDVFIDLDDLELVVYGELDYGYENDRLTAPSNASFNTVKFEYLGEEFYDNQLCAIYNNLWGKKLSVSEFNDLVMERALEKLV